MLDAYYPFAEELLCKTTKHLTYRREILISNFSEETTIQDVRIRFSIYGNIKKCYWVSNSEQKKRQACILFYEVSSGAKALKHGEHSEIYLHNHILQVLPSNKSWELLLYLKNNHGNTSINEVNDYCLLEIFEYLSISERLQLRKVSTRWCTIANISLRRLRHFDLGMYHKDLIYFENFKHSKQLLELFQNLGQCQLKKKVGISLSYSKVFSPLHIIACLNMHLLAMDCKHLTKLIVGCSTYDEVILTRIFQMNQELRHIEICYNSLITGKSLIHLPENIHTFIVKGCENLHSLYLCPAVVRLKNLKCLKLFEHNGYDILNIFNEYCKNVEILQLDFSKKYDYMDFNEFLPITNLKNLKDLRISTYAFITAKFFVNLSKNCQELRCLKIDSGGTVLSIPPARISERVMNAITSLTKLQVLSMHGINLGNLCKLRKVCIKDSDICEEQVVTVMQNSHELRKLAKNISYKRWNTVMLELITHINCDIRGTKKRRNVIYNGNVY